MTDEEAKPYHVRYTASFAANLADIETFWLENEYPRGYDAMLDELDRKVIPNLERFPGIGRLLIAATGGRRPRSAEALAGVKRIENAIATLAQQGVVREYVMKDYVVLYLMSESAGARSARRMFLLSIKHHKQLSFNLDSLWLPAPQ